MIAWPRLVIAGLVAAAVLWLVVEIRKDGAQSAISKIERQNNEAGRTADDDRSRFDLCPPGLWDFGAGKCRRATAGGRH